MQAYYRVGSITKAIRAKRLLESQGIRAYIKRHTDNEGCGYAVMVTNDSPTVMSMLKNGGVSAERSTKG